MKPTVPDIPIPKEVDKSNPRGTSMKRKTAQVYRRAFSETQLLDITEPEFEEGYSYHFITGGDIDALSYLKIIIRQQDLEYAFLSTWCMASEDIHQLDDWLNDGKIKRLDCYVGEIFPTSYKQEYLLLKDVMERHNGKLVCFKNHSKIFAGYGDKYHFGIQTSANINTNPRTENGCITIGKEIYQFYYDYFSGIVSFPEKQAKNRLIQ